MFFMTIYSIWIIIFMYSVGEIIPFFHNNINLFVETLVEKNNIWITIFLIFLIVHIIITIFYTIIKYFIFRQTDISNKTALIPFYSDYLLYHLSKSDTSYYFSIIMYIIFILLLSFRIPLFFLSLLPLIINDIVYHYHLSLLTYRKTSDIVYTILFPYIMIPIMTFSNKYKETEEDIDIFTVHKKYPWDEDKTK